jgi:DNA polymerase III subunit alpha
VLEAARDHLETGRNVVVTVEATLEGETLKLLARAVQPIDAVAAEAGSSGLRIHLRSPDAAPSVAGLLHRIAAEGARSRGPVVICVPDEATGREIDIALPKSWPVSPQVKGALRAMPGIALVEDL